MPDYKYRINELLDHLPKKDFAAALKALPIQLNVSSATFSNYRSIKLDDTQDIPHEKVAMLEKLFGIAPGELQNFTVSVNPISEISSLAVGGTKKHGLAKS